VTALHIFAGSWLASHAFLLVERSAGIEWDFHPDAAAYVTDYDLYVDDIANIPNNLYFFISRLLGGNLPALIELNILAYSLANAVGWLRIRQYGQVCGLSRGRILAATLVFLLQPYRLHLGVHVLKDTLIILMLLLAVSGAPRRMWLAVTALLALLALRVSAIIYFVGRLPQRLVVGLPVLASLALATQSQEVIGFLIARNELDMGGRDFNTVPSFEDYGAAGTLMRGALWPLLLMTGAFWLLSPAMTFLPIAVEMLAGRVVLAQLARVRIDWLPILAALGLMAMLVNSYTAYIRYGYPLVCLLPLLGLQMMARNKT